MDAKDIPGKAASSTWHYVRDEMLGVDDFKRVSDKAKKGDVLGAVKSGATGIGELGLTAASLVAGFFSGGTGAVGIQAAKAGAKQAVKTAAKTTVGTQAAKSADKAVIKFKPPKFGPQFGNKPTSGDWNPYRYVPPKKTPLKPLPGGDKVSTGGKTTTIDLTPSTRPDFNPLKDTKPFDPFHNPKTNPWPNMPKVEPKPAAPKPAPAPAPAPKPAPAKPKITTPWKPNSTVKPDAAKPGGKVSTNPGTEAKPQTEMKPTTGVSRKVAFGTGAAAAVGLMAFLPKPKTSDPDKWNPSSIV